MGAKGKGKGKIKAGEKKNKSLVKVFYPVNSSGFPAERRKRVNLLHPEVLRGSGWQRLKSPNFWQSSPAPRASCSSPAPQIGPGWCYCWRRQNKSPRSLLEKREIKSLNSLGEKKKKKVLKINLTMERVIQLPSSLLSLPLAFPSSACTNTSCGRGFSCAARGMERIPAKQPRWASSALPDTGWARKAPQRPCPALPPIFSRLQPKGQLVARGFGQNFKPLLL